MKKRVSEKNVHLWDTRTPENSEIVGVLWVDIVDISNYNEDIDVVAPVQQQYQIGYLLYDGPDPKNGGDMTVVATAYDYNEKRWASYTVFPSQVIHEMRVLAKPKKKKGK